MSWRRLRSVHQGVVALVVILVVVGGQWLRQPVRPFNEFDQPFYLGIAYDLTHLGRFTDGYQFAKPGPDGTRPAGMRFAPLYPALLAAAARLDGSLAANIDCLVDGAGLNNACGRAAPCMRAVQLAELFGVYWLIWWCAAAAGGAGRIAWLALALALFTSPLLLRSVNYLMTEMTALLFTTGATACALRMARAVAVNGAGRLPWRGGLAWGVATGAALAGAALTRPAFLYLTFAALAAGAVAAWRARRGVAALAGMAVGAALPLAPWMARNALVLGRAGLSFGYASHTLAQRISYDSMSWREYGLSYICWLPSGTAWGRTLNPPAGCDRFGYDAPDSFYRLGQEHLLGQTLAQAGGYDHHMAYLLHSYVFAHPVWHAAVSIPLALRGAYITHWWGFALFFVTVWTTLVALRRGNGRFLLVALPAWFMLALNAAVAVNQVRYNFMLILPYALAGALALDAAWRADKVQGYVKRATGGRARVVHSSIAP